MWKSLLVAAGMSAVTVPGHAQATHVPIPCPVLLVSGSADRESVHLSFLNKGKMPIQELSFACSPPTAGQPKGAICHTERGLFYPGTKYSVEFGYSGRAALDFDFGEGGAAGGWERVDGAAFGGLPAAYGFAEEVAGA